MSGDTWKRRSLARWLVGSGIEFGALNNPLHVPPNVDVRYVDRAPTQDLQRHYPELGDIVPVSIIGDAHDLRALSPESVDFVIANHVIEHLEDPVRGLLELCRVTRAGGLIFLAIPDQRATFDRRRPVTPVDHLVDEYRHGTASTRRAHFEEYVRLAERADDDEDSRDPAEITSRVEALLASDYSIHFHVFRPDTFLHMLAAAELEASAHFEIVAFAGCDVGEDDEFIFVLAKGIDPSPRSAPLPVVGEDVPEPTRQQLLYMIRRRSVERLRRTFHLDAR